MHATAIRMRDDETYRGAIEVRCFMAPLWFTLKSTVTFIA